MSLIYKKGNNSGLNNLFKDSSSMGDRAKYYVKLRCDKFIMTSQVRHSERGSVISDCFVCMAVEHEAACRMCRSTAATGRTSRGSVRGIPLSVRRNHTTSKFFFCLFVFNSGT